MNPVIDKFRNKRWYNETGQYHTAPQDAIKEKNKMSENVRDIRCKGCIWESPESGCNVVYSHERCVANRKFVEVEDFDKKKEAFEEGLKRIARCQEIFGKATTISLIGGSADIPVNLIRIDGIIEIDKLNTIYKILMGLDKNGDKDKDENVPERGPAQDRWSSL